jgi:hypothetical protein
VYLSVRRRDVPGLAGQLVAVGGQHVFARKGKTPVVAGE